MQLKLYLQKQRSKTYSTSNPKIKTTEYIAVVTESNFNNNKVVPTAVYLIGFNSVINFLALEVNVLWDVQKTRI